MTSAPAARRIWRGLLLGWPGVIVAATLVGGLLRWSHLDRLGVEHFDEGVYASNLLFGPAEHYEYPGRPFYAPPLLPWLIESTTLVLSILGFAARPWWPMLPGLIAGTLLIPSAGWIAGRWWGPRAGGLAAWLAALSAFHAAYSRTALTDPVVTLAILWAVYGVWVALGTDRFRPAILAGLATAVAWSTKYSGWLPLAIAVSGGAADVAMMASAERRLRRYVFGCLVVVMTAALGWLPVWWDTLRVGGYQAIAANHAGYVQGWSAWWGNWERQNAVLAWYAAGWWGWPLTISLLILGVAEKSHPLSCRAWWRTLPMVGWIALVEGITETLKLPWLVPLTLGAWAIMAAWWALRRGMLDAGERRAGVLVSAWFLGLLLTTPLYQPYPRLMLPWWLAGILWQAWWFARRVPAVSVDPAQGATTPHADSVNAAPAWMGALILVSLMWLGPEPRVWESRRSTRDAALSLRETLPRAADSVLYVYGDPALFHALRKVDLVAAPVATLALEPVPQAAATFLILGPFVSEEPSFEARWREVASRYSFVTTVEARPSSIVRFDHGGPDDALIPVDWRVFRIL